MVGQSLDRRGALTGGGAGLAPGVAVTAMPLALISVGRVALTRTGWAGAWPPIKDCAVGLTTGAAIGCTCCTCSAFTCTRACCTERPRQSHSR